VQKIIALLSLTIMSALTASDIAGFQPDLASGAATILFFFLILKKGLERRNLGGVFNLRKRRISFRSKNAVIELVLAIEYTLVAIASGAIWQERASLFGATQETLTIIGLTLLCAIFFYRIFYLDMFNEDAIDSDRLKTFFRRILSGQPTRR
jgi:tryptophan-rich sensory protein